MSHIRQIVVKIETSDIPDAGTNGEVYLGVGGREFRVDKPGNQFSRGNVAAQADVFIFGTEGGTNANVENPDINDPQATRMETSSGEAYNFPVYIRLDPKNDQDNDWSIQSVNVDINAAAAGGQNANYRFPDNTIQNGPVWLGRKSGLTLLLEKQP
jgi:hypothetical protein